MTNMRLKTILSVLLTVLLFSVLALILWHPLQTTDKAYFDLVMLIIGQVVTVFVFVYHDIFRSPHTDAVNPTQPASPANLSEKSP